MALASAPAPGSETHPGAAAAELPEPSPSPREAEERSSSADAVLPGTPRISARSAAKKRCVVVMYDTLCRHFLPSYNPTNSVKLGSRVLELPENFAEHFNTLSRKAGVLQYKNFYVGSMPTMPARREMHTGRYGFLHRGWGPLEPFDESMPGELKKNGIKSHLVTDNYHYWEAEGATYHKRYSSYSFIRGQEGDKWQPNFNKFRELQSSQLRTDQKIQDEINREAMRDEKSMPQYRTFKAGLDFIESHKDLDDSWYLQIETFDPHEPFYLSPDLQAEFKEKFMNDELFKDFITDEHHEDWPDYGPMVSEHGTRWIKMYVMLVAFCDRQLGRVLKLFDEHNLWNDTMLIVNTDHGFSMGDVSLVQEELWGKAGFPLFNEIAHIPFWIYNPERPPKAEKICEDLATTIDIPTTVLEYFGLKKPERMEGLVLGLGEKRTCVIYGFFGRQVNVTDGSYVYMRSPKNEDNQPLFEYTMMPCKMPGVSWATAPLDVPKLDFDEAAGRLVMAIKHNNPDFDWLTKLYRVRPDSGLLEHSDDEEAEQQELRMLKLLTEEMHAAKAPQKQYERLGLPIPSSGATKLENSCRGRLLRTQAGQAEPGVAKVPLSALRSCPAEGEAAQALRQQSQAPLETCMLPGQRNRFTMFGRPLPRK